MGRNQSSAPPDRRSRHKSGTHELRDQMQDKFADVGPKPARAEDLLGSELSEQDFNKAFSELSFENHTVKYSGSTKDKARTRRPPRSEWPEASDGATSVSQTTYLETNRSYPEPRELGTEEFNVKYSGSTKRKARPQPGQSSSRPSRQPTLEQASMATPQETHLENDSLGSMTEAGFVADEDCEWQAGELQDTEVPPWSGAYPETIPEEGVYENTASLPSKQTKKKKRPPGLNIGHRRNKSSTSSVKSPGDRGNGIPRFSFGADFAVPPLQIPSSDTGAPVFDDYEHPESAPEDYTRPATRESYKTIDTVATYAGSPGPDINWGGTLAYGATMATEDATVQERPPFGTASTDVLGSGWEVASYEPRGYWYSEEDGPH